MAIDFATDVQGFNQEDDATFGGASDMQGYWYSKADTREGDTASGLFFPVGNHDFDDAVDALNADRTASGKLPIPQVTIVHDDSNQKGNKEGSSNIKTYWHWQSGSLFVIARGLQSPLPEQGIVYCWTLDEKRKYKTNAKGQAMPNMSHLKFRAFLQELTGPGYYMMPIMISAKSYRAGYFLSMLKEQKKTLDAFKEFMKNPKLPLPFYAFSIPFEKSGLVQVGSEKKKGMIMPQAALPKQYDQKWFEQHYVKATDLEGALLEMISNELVNTLVWAKEETERILAGPQQQEASQSAQAFSDSTQSFEEYINHPWQDEVDPSPAQAQPKSNLATEKQCEALRKMGHTDIAGKPGLTLEEASNAIKSGRKK